MKKIILFLIVISILITGCQKKDQVKKEEIKDSMKEVMITINNKEYELELDDNETVKDFLELLPLSISMSELNGNEKYFYLDQSLSTNPTNPKNITQGDVMLFGDNCLVIFYKSFETSYSYTKIGHINDLDDLGKEEVMVEIK